ncbi:phage tail tape measure protein [Sporosarcina sp. SAFN-010]|uniref:phage tail tape measure protein n=1 Tax=Sporosarcina sp. SAFN-010 TaxID=3387273 RepID=UPI003F810B4F
MITHLIEAEAGGSAMSMVMKKIDKAVSLGGGAVERFTEGVGLNAKEFAEMWKANPIDALNLFIESLGKSGREGENLAAMLDFMGIKGIREQDTILRLAGAQGLLTESLDIANKGWSENSALSNEAAERYKTLESKMAIFSNVIKDIGISIGDALLPYITQFVDKMTELGKWIGDLNPKFLQLGALVAAASAAFLIVGGSALLLIGFVPQIITGFMALSTVAGALGTAFTVLTGPIGIAIAAIVAIGAALVVAYNKVDWFRAGVDKAWSMIKQATATAFNAIRSTITSIMGAVLTFAKSQLDILKNFWNANGKAIVASVKTHFSNIQATIKMVMGIIQGIFQVAWPLISGIVKVAWALIQSVVTTAIQLVLGIIQTTMRILQGDWKGAWDTIKTTASNILSSIVSIFRGIDLVQIGKNIIQGLINGIGSMASAVVEKVKSIASSIPEWAKKMLGIHSPSRVMIEIGKHTGQGLANGIASMKGVVTASIKGLTSVLLNVTKASNAEINAIHRKQSADEKKIIADKNRDIANIHAQARAKKRKLTVSEIQRIAKIESDAKAKLVANERKHGAEIVKVQEKVAKDRLAAIKQYVEDKKSTEELSLVAEAEVWRRSLAQFKAGTKERVEAQKQYQAAVEAVNKEVTAINQEYADKMQKINDDLAKSEHDLNAEYNKAYSDRVSAITGFANTFDEFVSKFEGTGQTLLDNLQSQVTGLQDWRSVLDSLWGKIDDQALMEELEAMGPKALGELQALNGLSEQQLTQYVALYNQKFALARDQADKELAGMKEDTANRITAMRETANAELEKMCTEWTSKIVALTKVTDTELKSLKDIGKNAGQGLLNGLASMEPALIAKATSIANSIKAAMAAAFDIHSPSRWMRDFIGVNMMRGWIDGMASMQSRVIGMSRQATDWMTPAVPQIAGYQAPSRSSIRTASVGATLNGEGKSGITVTQTLHFHDHPISPAEAARKQKQAAQQLALQWQTR